VLCCAVLCCAVLCCAVLCCAVLCCAVLFCSVLFLFCFCSMLLRTASCDSAGDAETTLRFVQFHGASTRVQMLEERLRHGSSAAVPEATDRRPFAPYPSKAAHTVVDAGVSTARPQL
jgi:hypothetical protein